jgi:hypothetical protein
MSRFDALSKPQVEACCNVAFGGDGAGIARNTLSSLAHLGVIEPFIERERTPLGYLAIRKWMMPLPTHREFCEWCQLQADPDSSKDLELGEGNTP